MPGELLSKPLGKFLEKLVEDFSEEILEKTSSHEVSRGMGENISEKYRNIQRNIWINIYNNSQKNTLRNFLGIPVEIPRKYILGLSELVPDKIRTKILRDLFVGTSEGISTKIHEETPGRISKGITE